MVSAVKTSNLQVLAYFNALSLHRTVQLGYKPEKPRELVISWSTSQTQFYNVFTTSVISRYNNAVATKTLFQQLHSPVKRAPALFSESHIYCRVQRSPPMASTCVITFLPILQIYIPISSSILRRLSFLKAFQSKRYLYRSFLPYVLHALTVSPSLLPHI
jgi:hypothetical protein